ncbi:transporter substrate-binding domain-containing protein [Phaeobacter sp. HF9A]|uniref:transporter substrate-binding domain-containing protein n=1 Tax=Phaeobacter sp. HF9A TaxID=2721561 RepID=UPI00142FD470|nr:transporter substrate-binding domain-containing protein [Phaeobacter sp. HF9A]NIZ15393.1 amino acid ABC transporter substrate-binding protein [Phaeobacter sp. HF9A]
MFDFIKTTTAIVALSGSLCTLAQAETIAIAQLPLTSESAEKGLYIDMLREMKANGDLDLDIKVVPFPRSIKMLIDQDARVQLPMLDPGNGKPPAPGLQFSSAEVHPVPFALYYNRDKPLDMDNLGQYNIETEQSHVPFFDVEFSGSTCVECSLKKVNSGRIDGFVFASPVVGEILQANDLPNVAEVPFQDYPARFLIREGDVEMDAALSKAIDNMRASSRLDIVLEQE